MPLAKVVSDILNNDLSRVIVAVLLVVGTIAVQLVQGTVPTPLWDLDKIAIIWYFAMGVAKTR
ncbi:MAG TPA: hypothetical protein V6C97_27530 [Oculatellaceae cyanobacterium]